MSKRVLAIGLCLAAVLVTGCSSDDEVRAVCAGHGGVNAASGNLFRRYVACRDGYFRTVR